MFELASKRRITMRDVEEWKAGMEGVAATIERQTDKSTLYGVLLSLLTKAATINLQPLQVATIQKLASVIIDALFAVRVPVKEVVDDLIDLHLSFIDGLQELINNVHKHPDAMLVEALCYQFAGLTRIVFDQVDDKVNPAYFPLNDAPSMFVSDWTMPIYARLKRRFETFSSEDKSAKWAQLTSAAYLRLLHAMPLEIHPKYNLTSSLDTAEEVPSATSSYPPQDIAEFMLAVANEVMLPMPYTELDDSMMTIYKADLSDRLKAVGKELVALDYSRDKLFDSELAVVEKALDIGHTAVGLQLSSWQLKPLIDIITEGHQSPVPPVNFTSIDAMLLAIPLEMRGNAKLNILEHMERNKITATDEQASAAVLGWTMKQACMSSMNALIAYQANGERINTNTAYQQVFTALLIDALTSTSLPVHFHENMIAIGVLEVVLATTDSWEANKLAYRNALIHTIFRHLTTKEIPAEELTKRIDALDNAVQLHRYVFLEAIAELRTSAFEKVIHRLLVGEEGSNGLSGMKAVFEDCEYIATVVGLPAPAALEYVMSLALERFDGVVVDMLSSFDPAMDLPGIGEIYQEQVYTMGEEIRMSVEDIHDRSALMAGATMIAYINLAIQEAQANGNTAKTVLNYLEKLFMVYQHPYLKIVQAQMHPEDIRDVGMRQVIQRLPPSTIVEVVKMLDHNRIKLQKGGDSSSVVDQEAFQAFLLYLQTFFMKQYASGKFYALCYDAVVC